MNGIHIRKAERADIVRMSYLIRKNTAKVKANNYNTEQMNAWRQANTVKALNDSWSERIVFCAFQHSRMVATIALKTNEIVGFYVSYSKRGLGIGKKLFQYLEDFARAQQLEELTLSSTPSARKFYKANGYTAIRSVVVRIAGVDFPETEMRKRL